MGAWRGNGYHRQKTCRGKPANEDGTATAAPEDALPADTLGLALSGGGIRSAAFCLGVIQVGFLGQELFDSWLSQAAP